MDDHLEPLGQRGFGDDAAGLRARSTPPGIAWEETRHYLLPDGSPFYEVRLFGGPGVPTDARSFVFVGDRLLAVIEHAPVGEKSVVEHVVSDHIAFPVMTLDADGAETWQARDVLPFGEIAVATGDADPLLRYPGQWAMPGPSPGMTELLSNGYRWYRPGWGRYTQSDPMPSSIGFHDYSYARNSPFAWIDPNGLTPTPPSGCPELPDGCECGNWELKDAKENILARNGRWALVGWRPAAEDHIRCWCKFRLVGEHLLYEWIYEWKAEVYCFPCWKADPVETRTKGPVEERYQPIWGGQEVERLAYLAGRGCGCSASP